MFEKRFMEFATQNTDNGEINNGFHDIKTGEWYYTKDSENAKKICELLNELYDENDILKQKLKTKYIVNKQYEELQKVKKENEQLKQRNTNQYNQLNELWEIIEEENWEKLIAMKKQLKEDEERLQREWKCYE